jgi:hypothetical protein
MTIVLHDSERTPCEIWDRVMGYHRPTTYWNKGKQAERRDRKYFLESRTLYWPQKEKIIPLIGGFDG